MTANLAHHARAEIEHGAVLKAARAAVEAAQARRDQVASRVDDITTNRAAIIARRALGHQAEDDGARLALAAADLDGLVTLLSSAEATLSDALDAHRQAIVEVAQAAAGFAVEEARAEVLAFDGHADRLIELLADTMERRRAASARLPIGDRDFARSLDQLTNLDSVVSCELSGLRGVLTSSAREMVRVTWMPSDVLYQNIWRLHNGGGRL